MLYWTSKYNFENRCAKTENYSAIVLKKNAPVRHVIPLFLREIVRFHRNLSTQLFNVDLFFSKPNLFFKEQYTQQFLAASPYDIK